MRSDQRKPVAVIGAGLAGLTAARFLRRHGVPVVLHEAAKQIAGLATTFTDREGFSYDFGAHFITNRLAAAIGVGAHCRNAKHYSETVWLRDRAHAYPFGLLGVPRFLRSGVVDRMRGLRNGREPLSAADWFRAKYGSALADEVALPLVESWSGASASELAPSVGESIPGSIAHTLLLKLAGRLTSRAVAIGYSREMPEAPSVWHVYPDGGVGLLCLRLAEGLDDVLQRESPVEAIFVEDGSVVGIRVRGQDRDVSAVISTAPVHALARLIRGTDALQHLARFRYRPMVFVNLRFRGRKLLPDLVTWTPESRFPFFRLTETPLSMPWLAPVGKTLITVDIGCEVGDAIWTMAEDALGEFCVEHLTPVIRDARRRYLGCRVLRTPIAYPVFLRSYEKARQHLEQGTGIEGLHSIGRNGEFAHIFMEDVYWRTRKKMRQLLFSLHEGQTTSSGQKQ